MAGWTLISTMATRPPSARREVEQTRSPGGANYGAVRPGARPRPGRGDLVDDRADGEHGGAGDDARRRQGDGEHHAAGEAEHGERTGPAPLLGRERPGGDVGDGVVGEHGEGAEPDRAAQVGERATSDDHGTPPTASSARWGTRWVGWTASSHAGQVAVGGHGEGGAADAGEQREQHAERGDRAADAHDRRQPRQRAGSHGRRQRRGARRPARRGRRPAARETATVGVDDQGDAERDRDRPGDGAGGIDDLLAERGDAGVAGEGEEQQARRLEDPRPPADAERAEVGRRSPGRRRAQPTTTAASEARTTATMDAGEPGGLAAPRAS